MGQNHQNMFVVIAAKQVYGERFHEKKSRNYMPQYERIGWNQFVLICRNVKAMLFHWLV